MVIAKRHNQLRYDRWDVSTSERKRDVAIRPGSVTQQSFQDLIALDGRWNCADFWIDVQYDDDDPETGPAAGWSSVVLSLWAKNGLIETILDTKALSDHEGILLPQRSTKRSVQAILLSARDRPCDGFIVRAQPYSSLESPYTHYARAKLSLDCWGVDASNPNDLQGRTIVDPFAPREQWWDSVYTYLNGASGRVNAWVPRAIYPDNSRRAYVTGIQIFSQDGLRHELALESSPDGLAWTQRWNSLINNTSPMAVLFNSPLRGDPGGYWAINLNALSPATNFYVSVQGFLE